MGLHDGEVLTDNTQIHRCEQCKDCIFWGNSDAFSNAYDKTNCDIYPYPAIKPGYIMYNTGKCKYKQSK